MILSYDLSTPHNNLLTFNLITKFENSQIEIEITFTCLA